MRERTVSVWRLAVKKRPVGRKAMRMELGPQRAAQITMKTADWDTCRGRSSPKEVNRVPTYLNTLIPSCCLLSDTSQCAKRQQMFHKPCSQTVFSPFCLPGIWLYFLFCRSQPSLRCFHILIRVLTRSSQQSGLDLDRHKLAFTRFHS